MTDTQPTSQEMETITKKELFEKLIALDAKCSLIITDNKTITRKFEIYIIVLLIIQILNIVLIAVSMFK